MRKLISTILIIISTYSFAISQKLIDGANEHDVTVAKSRILLDEHIKDSSKFVDVFFKAYSSNLPETDKKLAERELIEMDKRKQDFYKQQATYEEIIKKLKPIKAEYDRQIARKERIKDTVFSAITISMLLGIFFLIIYFSISTKKKYDKLLKEGKITQEQYDHMMRSVKSNINDYDTNPATGLRMTGGIDSAGNPRGCSSSPHYNSSSSSCSSSSTYQRYEDRYH